MFVWERESVCVGRRVCVGGGEYVCVWERERVCGRKFGRECV